ncbi:alpha-E domain-containing protein [Piscinibacter sp.]|uniref:alpha-E domain-containing protein n=1 Tax=Piscinibacter sp. TaxID=1903157 RepID=UPI00391F72A4
MLSRTADHLFWMARYMERAGLRAHARSAEGDKVQWRAPARSGVFGPEDLSDAL